MSGSSGNESEILLGNKQLLAVFAVVAFLLAIAFTGGYMLGKSSAENKAVTAAEGQGTADNTTALVPRTVTPEDARTDATASKMDQTTPPPADSTPAAPEVKQTPPRALPKTVAPATPLPSAEKPAASEKQSLMSGKGTISEGTPKHGQTFVQVAALTHTEAEATAEVLRKQNFQARIAPKPGSTSIYRVLVGPAHDASEITATRDALRKIGFRDVYVQRY